jgi:cytokinesis protein
MYTAGLSRILELCAAFGVPNIDNNIKKINVILDDDAKSLKERLDQEILKDFTNPEDVYRAITARVKGSKAEDYFLSMMQHLLLIREEGQPMVHYYQLLDGIVTDVVMDKKLEGAEQRLGYSVERVIAQFNEADRYQGLEDEATEARAMAMRLKLEKEALEEEISQGHDGLVGSLKKQLASAEEKLTQSREMTSRLHKQLDNQKASYEAKIAQLEAQIMELFKMLKEFGKGADTLMDAGSMDRKTLVEQLERNFQRHKTITKLEGKDFNASPSRKKSSARRNLKGGEEDGEYEDNDTTPVKGGGSLRRSKASGSKRLPKLPGQPEERASQFLDADDDDAHEQIQQQLAAGVKLVGLHCI